MRAPVRIPTAPTAARPRSAPPRRPPDDERLERIKHVYGVYDDAVPSTPPRARSPPKRIASKPADVDDADQKYMGRARRLVRRVVAALHQGEGSPNYGMIFKQLDVCGHGAIQRHNLKSRLRSLLKPAPKDRHIDLLFDALDSDDSNEVVTLKEFAQFARAAELPADFLKPKPKLDRPVVKRPRSAPAVRRRIRTLSIQQSERAAHPATRKKAIQLLQALHRTVAATDAQLRFGNLPETRDRLVSRLGAPPNQLTPARLWHKIAKFGVVDREELGRRVRELLGGDVSDSDVTCLYECCDLEQRGVVTLQDFAHFARRVDLTISPPPPRRPRPKKTFAETVPARPKPTEVVVAPRPTSDKTDRMARAAAEALFYALASTIQRESEQHEKVNYARMFRKLDVHGRGRLDRNELRHQIVRLLPAPPARFATDALFDACDTDGTGFVERAEFATYARGLAFGVAARHAERAREVQKRPASAPREIGRTHIALEVSAPPRRPPLAPEDLARAAALFEHIARRVDMDSADRAGGFGVAKRDIAYGRVFRKLCVFGEESLDAGELVRACRRAFLDNLKGVADADLRLLYNAIDEDGTGVVALEDFARFAKKIRGRLFDVQVARPEPPAPATRESRVNARDRSRAEAILCRLGEVVASRGGSSSFNDAHRGQGVSFARLFHVLDPESAAMGRADLIEAVKKRTATVSDEDLGFLFDVIDEDSSGLVTLGEFHAFSKRVAVPSEGFRTGGGPLSETRGTAPLPPPSNAPTARAKPKWTPRSVKLADRSRDCRGGPPARSRRPLCLDGRAKKLVPQ